MYARERQYLHNFAPKGHKIKLETSQSLVKSRKEAEKHAKSLAETRNLAQKKAANASNAYSQNKLEDSQGIYLYLILPVNEVFYPMWRLTLSIGGEEERNNGEIRGLAPPRAYALPWGNALDDWLLIYSNQQGFFF